MRLGVLGGTFDPIHIGHLSVAVEVRHALALDRVLLVVANVPWQKAGERAISPAEDRWAMAAAAVEGVEGVDADRREIDRGGESYTVETLEALRSEGHDLFLIVGSDVAGSLDTWKRHEELPHLATLVVVERPGAPASAPPAGWMVERVDVPALDVSSSDLRDRARHGRPLDVLVPPAALRVLRERGLYADGSG
ncbi:MAG TPA: nicotinate-nucleotide adenylyltransferase [Acidimicrobiales bacterium]|nr:nicotinate-nucleotide adenylyltransferase [Acidimicrobiales bacterium]